MASLSTLNEHAQTVAQRLLGCYIIRDLGHNKMVGMIVETEAYDQTDQASHSFRGETPRTKVMFGPAGFAYIYFTYGMHYCFNVVVGESGYGAAVLVRALEPIEGIDYMLKNRQIANQQNITNGPAKLCQALVIDKRLSGHDLRKAPLRLIINKPIKASQIVTTTRIGISKEKYRPWRYYIEGNSFISKK